MHKSFCPQWAAEPIKKSTTKTHHKLIMTNLTRKMLFQIKSFSMLCVFRLVSTIVLPVGRCLVAWQMTDALEPGPHTKGCSGVTVIVMPLSISPPSDGNVPVWHWTTTNYPASRLLPWSLPVPPQAIQKTNNNDNASRQWSTVGCDGSFWKVTEAKKASTQSFFFMYEVAKMVRKLK